MTGYRWLLSQMYEGSQYTSIAFDNRCKTMGVCPSMGSFGDCFDNAMAENFGYIRVSQRTTGYFRTRNAVATVPAPSNVSVQNLGGFCTSVSA